MNGTSCSLYEVDDDDDSPQKGRLKLLETRRFFAREISAWESGDQIEFERYIVEIDAKLDDRVTNNASNSKGINPTMSQVAYTKTSQPAARDAAPWPSRDTGSQLQPQRRQLLQPSQYNNEPRFSHEKFDEIGDGIRTNLQRGSCGQTVADKYPIPGSLPQSLPQIAPSQFSRVADDYVSYHLRGPDLTGFEHFADCDTEYIRAQRLTIDSSAFTSTARATTTPMTTQTSDLLNLFDADAIDSALQTSPSTAHQQQAKTDALSGSLDSSSGKRPKLSFSTLRAENSLRSPGDPKPSPAVHLDKAHSANPPQTAGAPNTNEIGLTNDLRSHTEPSWLDQADEAEWAWTNDRAQVDDDRSVDDELEETQVPQSLSSDDQDQSLPDESPYPEVTSLSNDDTAVRDNSLAPASRSRTFMPPRQDVSRDGTSSANASSTSTTSAHANLPSTASVPLGTKRPLSMVPRPLGQLHNPPTLHPPTDDGNHRGSSAPDTSFEGIDFVFSPVPRFMFPSPSFVKHSVELSQNQDSNPTAAVAGSNHQAAPSLSTGLLGLYPQHALAVPGQPAPTSFKNLTEYCGRLACVVLDHVAARVAELSLQFAATTHSLASASQPQKLTGPLLRSRGLSYWDRAEVQLVQGFKRRDDWIEDKEEWLAMRRKEWMKRMRAKRGKRTGGEDEYDDYDALSERSEATDDSSDNDIIWYLKWTGAQRPASSDLARFDLWIASPDPAFEPGGDFTRCALLYDKYLANCARSRGHPPPIKSVLGPNFTSTAMSTFSTPRNGPFLLLSSWQSMSSKLQLLKVVPVEWYLNPIIADPTATRKSNAHGPRGTRTQPLFLPLFSPTPQPKTSTSANQMGLPVNLLHLGNFSTEELMLRTLASVYISNQARLPVIRAIAMPVEVSKALPDLSLTPQDAQLSQLTWPAFLKRRAVQYADKSDVSSLSIVSDYLTLKQRVEVVNDSPTPYMLAWGLCSTVISHFKLNHEQAQVLYQTLGWFFRGPRRVVTRQLRVDLRGNKFVYQDIPGTSDNIVQSALASLQDCTDEQVSRVLLIHGAFGSGKSHALSALIVFLTKLCLAVESSAFDSRALAWRLKVGDEDGAETEHDGSRTGELLPFDPTVAPSQQTSFLRILFASQTNAATDNVLLRLIKLGYRDFARVGSIPKIAKPVLRHVMCAVDEDTGEDQTSSCPSDESQEQAQQQALRELQRLLEEVESGVDPSESEVYEGDSMATSELSAELEDEVTSIKSAIAEIRAEPALRRFERLSRCRLIGVTCASSSFPVLRMQRKFAIVILDECSQIPEPLALAPIHAAGAEAMMLVGDPKQLAPTLPSLSSMSRMSLPSLQDAPSASSSNQTRKSSAPLAGYRAFARYAESRAGTCYDPSLGLTMFVRLSLSGLTPQTAASMTSTYRIEPLMLRRQYRVPPSLAALLSCIFYEGKLLSGIRRSDTPSLFSTLDLAKLDPQERGQLLKLNSVEGEDGNASSESSYKKLASVAFVDVAAGTARRLGHASPRTAGTQHYGVNGGSLINREEAIAVCQIVMTVLLGPRGAGLASSSRGARTNRAASTSAASDLLSPDDIGVISVYRAQANLIRTLIAEAWTAMKYGQVSSSSSSLGTGSSFDTYNKRRRCPVLVSTVDAFQGGERRLIILSCVSTSTTEFAEANSRICVALSRAQRNLIILGNANALRDMPLWRTIIDFARGGGRPPHSKFSEEEQIRDDELSYFPSPSSLIKLLDGTS